MHILIVEDEPIIAKLIEQQLIDDDHTIAGIAHDGETALEMIKDHKPALILLDIKIEGTLDGVRLAEIINAEYDIPFIFLTAYSNTSTLHRAKASCPCGYVVKPHKAADLYSAIAIGMYNYRNRKSKNELTLEGVNNLAMDPLSKKEFEIIKDLIEGYTNAQIAERQYLSRHTVKWHLQNIYAKLGVTNRTAAAKLMMSI